MPIKINSQTSTRSGKPRPTLESTTAAVFNPGTVELEPCGVSGGGREIRKKSNC